MDICLLGNGVRYTNSFHTGVTEQPLDLVTKTLTGLRRVALKRKSQHGEHLFSGGEEGSQRIDCLF